MHTAKYKRHENCVCHQDRMQRSGHTDDLPAGDNSGQKRQREVHFSFLPDRYEPLIDEGKQVEAKEKKTRKKEQFKKVKKNVSKAFRVTWKCIMLGLHNFAHGYSTPITVAAAFLPDFHLGRSTT